MPTEVRTLVNLAFELSQLFNCDDALMVLPDVPTFEEEDAAFFLGLTGGYHFESGDYFDGNGTLGLIFDDDSEENRGHIVICLIFLMSRYNMENPTPAFFIEDQSRSVIWVNKSGLIELHTAGRRRYEKLREAIRDLRVRYGAAL